MKLTLNSISVTVLLGTLHLTRMVLTTDPSGNNHKVSVGKDGHKFDPSHISAKKGDTITFVFYQEGHTLTQTHFDNPCAGMDPLFAPICTATSAASKNDTLQYPTVGSGTPTSTGNSYPTDGLQYTSPSDSNTTSHHTDGLDYPTTSNSTDSYPTDASKTQPSFTDPTQTSNYPSGPDPPTKEKTCDGKCIEVAQQCQISSDCKAQSESPNDTKCKMEGGQCKRCGESASSLVQKRNYVASRFGHFENKLARRRPDGDLTAVNDSTDVNTEELQTAPGKDVANENTTNQPSTTTSPAGLDSGFVKVKDSEKSTGNSWSIKITIDNKPLWFMCATPKHCTSGMVFAVNAPESGDKSFDAFLKAATTSTCAANYPSKVNLQGDGVTATAPPCGSQKQNDTSSAPPPANPQATDPSKAPPNTDSNSTTPTQTSIPTPDPSPSPTTTPRTTSSEDKPSSEGHSTTGNRISFTVYVFILLSSFIISET